MGENSKFVKDSLKTASLMLDSLTDVNHIKIITFLFGVFKRQLLMLILLFYQNSWRKHMVSPSNLDFLQAQIHNTLLYKPKYYIKIKAPNGTNYHA